MMKVSMKSIGLLSSIYSSLTSRANTLISPVQTIMMLPSDVGWISMLWMLWAKRAPMPYA